MFIQVWRRGAVCMSCDLTYYEGSNIMDQFVRELWAFMRERKKFWLLPILLVLFSFGTLIVLTQGSAVAPFIYTLF
jgi:hypothetical protein